MLARAMLMPAFLVILAAAGQQAPAAAGSRKGRATMRAGFARVKITPPLGTRMMGFGGRDYEHGCTAIHDDIFVRAAYLQQGDEAAVIMGFDLCFVGRAETVRYRERLKEKLGLEPGQVLFNASHSHVGPMIGTWYWAKYVGPETAYVDQLEAAVVEAATEAKRNAREVTVWAGATRSSLPMSRRKLNAEGKAEFIPNPGGLVFGHLPLCLFRDAQGQPVCLLLSVSCHPSTIGGWEISAEYPGVALAGIDAHLGATASLFLQGTGGDAKACVIGVGSSRSAGEDHWRAGTWEDVKQAGEIVAKEVNEALDRGLTQVQPRLRSEATIVEWPMERPLDQAGYEAIAADESAPEVRRRWAKQWADMLQRGEKLPAAVPLELQGIQIADGMRIVALEGEAVAGWGHFFQRFFGDGVTFGLGYSNGEGLYLPTSDIMDQGGYEVDSFWEYHQPARLAKGFEGILTKALERMHGKIR